MITKKILFMSVFALTIPAMIMAHGDSDAQKNISQLMQQSTQSSSKVSEIAPLYPVLGAFGGAVGASLLFKFVLAPNADPVGLGFLMAGGGLLGYIAGETAAKTAENLSKHNALMSSNQLAAIKLLLEHSNK